MRENNFDIIRLILACMVVLVHANALSEMQAFDGLTRYISSQVAVEGFFAISGFLIFASYERCASVKQYFTNRAWRILPGYWLSTLFCLVIAFCFGSFHVGRFLLANLTFANFLAPGIPGVFESNPHDAALNGALWTLKIEVLFYLSVPCIVWLCRRLHRDTVLGALFVASVIFRMRFAHDGKWAVQLPGQLSYFMVGALIFYHLERFKRHRAAVIAVACLLYVLHAGTGWYFPRPAAIATLTLVACLLLPHVKGPTRFGDFSYGTYILHWPILQLVVYFGLFHAHPWAALCLSLLLVACAAVFSWSVVEKPSLAHARSRRLRLAAAGAEPNYPPAP